MKNLFIYPILLISLLAAPACSDDAVEIPKDNNEEEEQLDPPKEEEPGETASEYLQSKREAIRQEYTIDMANAPLSIVTDGGIVFQIQPGTFTIEGEAVEGEITFEIHEMLSLSSIVFSGTNTNYEGWRNSYFQTDGFFHIDAMTEGRQVDEYLAYPMRVTVPNNGLREDATWTMIWPATENGGETEDQFAWTDPDDDDRNWWGEAWNNENGDFEFDLGKLGWCNCDVFWEGDMTTITVKLTGEFGPFASYLALDGETFVFFCAKGFPVLAQLYTVVDDSTVKSYDNSVSKDAVGRMFAFSIMDGVYTYAEQEVTITEDMVVTLDMREVEKEYIDERISSLDGYK